MTTKKKKKELKIQIDKKIASLWKSSFNFKNQSDDDDDDEEEEDHT